MSKTTKYLFIFDLDSMTWTKSSPVNCAFNGDPDQVYFIMGEKDGLLYFTADGVTNGGVQAPKATSGASVCYNL